MQLLNELNSSIKMPVLIRNNFDSYKYNLISAVDLKHYFNKL